MKKKVVLLYILILTLIVPITSLAATGNESVEINMTSSIEIEKETETVTLTVSLGKLTDIPEDAIMGLEAKLNYDDAIIKNVEVEGKSDWVVNYSNTTKKIIAEYDEGVAKENTSIFDIILTIDENANSTTTKVELTEALLTVNDEFDFNYEKEANITIKEPKEEVTPKGNELNIPNQTEEEPASPNTIEKVPDLTTAKDEKMPQTGSTSTIYIILVGIFLIGIYSFVRYKRMFK